MYYRYNNLDILEKVETPYEYIKKLNILLIRHGESEVNEMQERFKKENRLLTEDLKIEDAMVKLTENGKKQAIELGKYLKDYMIKNNIKSNDVLVLVSPYERARQTFELANRNMKFKEDGDNIFVLNCLTEQFFGAFHMISRDIKKQVYGKIYEECSKNTISYFKPTLLGESPQDVSNRLWNAIYFIKEYTEINKTKNVFIFGHGNANKCMLMNILNLPPEFYKEFPNEENSSIINIKNGRYCKIKK